MVVLNSAQELGLKKKSLISCGTHLKHSLRTLDSIKRVFCWIEEQNWWNSHFCIIFDLKQALWPAAILISWISYTNASAFHLQFSRMQIFNMYQHICLSLKAICSECPQVKWNATALDWTQILVKNQFCVYFSSSMDFLGKNMRNCNHWFFEYEFHIQNGPSNYKKMWIQFIWMSENAISSRVKRRISARIVWQMNIFIANESAAIGSKHTKLSGFMLYKHRISSKKGCGKTLSLQMVLLLRWS